MKVGVELCAKMSILRVLRVGRAVHQAITEGREVSGKNSLSEFALHSFKTTTVIVAEGRLDYRAIFKYVSYQGS